MSKTGKTRRAASGIPKGELLQIRLTTAEKDAFFSAAETSGLSLSAWIRERLRTIALRELIEAGKAVPFVSDNPG